MHADIDSMRLALKEQATKDTQLASRETFGL